MSPYAAARVCELGLAQQLVLLTLRSLNEHHAGRLGMCVPNALWSVFGPAYVELALRGIEGAHRVLLRHARRPPDLIRPVDPGITTTERCLLELLSATAHGQDAYRDGLCRWLVLPAGRESLGCCAGFTVRALEYRRLRLPPPSCVVPRTDAKERVRLASSRVPGSRLSAHCRGGRAAARH